MVGLIYAIGAVFYLIISFFIVIACGNHFERKFKRYSAGIVIGIVIAYSLIFWDLIPVYGAHKYYCNADSGVYTLTPPGVWLEDNPTEVGRLDSNSKYPKSEYLGNGRSRSWRSDRLYINYSQEVIFFGLIRRYRVSLVDASNQNSLLEMTDYVSNYRELLLGGESASFKSWLQTGYCPGNLLEEFTRQLRLYK